MTTLPEEDLIEEAKKCELEALQSQKLGPECISALDELLHGVYVALRPKETDYQHRRDLIQAFNDIAKGIYGNCNGFPIVEIFGSFVMDIFTPSSDLDLSVNFSEEAVDFPREKKIETLKKFTKEFNLLQSSKGQFSKVTAILNAIVPIVKVVDSGTGVECDLSIENRDAILKSEFVHIISSIDERFQKLCFLMKQWAKAHKINSSRNRTLNSLSIVLLVAFHLQTQDPPILPPFSALLKDGFDLANVTKEVGKFSNYGSGNKESLAELFFSLLVKLDSVEKLWSHGLCASTYQGSWIYKTWNSNVACISVEDFLDRHQNVSRAVGQKKAEKINYWIDWTINRIFAFISGKIDGPNLREVLFGRDFDKPARVKKNKPKKGKRKRAREAREAGIQIPIYQSKKARRVEKQNLINQARGVPEPEIQHPSKFVERINSTGMKRKQATEAPEAKNLNPNNHVMRVNSKKGKRKQAREGPSRKHKDLLHSTERRQGMPNPIAGWGMHQHVPFDPIQSRVRSEGFWPPNGQASTSMHQHFSTSYFHGSYIPQSPYYYPPLISHQAFPRPYVNQGHPRHFGPSYDEQAPYRRHFTYVRNAQNHPHGYP